MYVNPSPRCHLPPSTPNPHHLLNWFSSEAKLVGYNNQIYSLNSIFDTPALSMIIKTIDEEYQSVQTGDMEQDNILYWFQVLEGLLLRECDRRFRVCFRNRVLKDGGVGDLLKILLFCCVNSQDKQEYIERIFNLSEQIQSSLMLSIQQINQNSLHITSQSQILTHIEHLQTQAETLRSSLSMQSQKQQSSQKQIKELEQELQNRNKELKKYKIEEQRIIQMLQITNFQQYISAFKRLQQQNRILNRYVEELEDNNGEMEGRERLLRKELEMQGDVIGRLREEVGLLRLQQAYKDKDRDGQIGRNFGNEINVDNKQNIISSSSLKPDKSHIPPPPSQKSSPTLSCQHDEQLKQQMQQLRKYNTDLISKLQTSYKALNNITEQTSRIKQKNQSLTKQNRFYRKQINSLRKLQQKMEIDLIRGLI